MSGYILYIYIYIYVYILHTYSWRSDASTCVNYNNPSFLSECRCILDVTRLDIRKVPNVETLIQLIYSGPLIRGPSNSLWAFCLSVTSGKTWIPKGEFSGFSQDDLVAMVSQGRSSCKDSKNTHWESTHRVFMCLESFGPPSEPSSTQSLWAPNSRILCLSSKASLSDGEACA